MSGLTIPFTGTNNKLCVHYLPGARGDFLASVLLDQFIERGNGALRSPDYYKEHHNFNRLLFPNDCICIRIDDNRSIDNIMQITFNGFLKNKVVKLDDINDHFYTRIKNTFCDLKESINPANYNYWIDFSSLADINFLKGLYYHYNQREISSTLEDLIKQNLFQQINWKSQPGLEKLSWLIEFEVKCNLLHWNKTFSIQEYMLSDNPKSLLTFKNYSLEPFIL